MPIYRERGESSNGIDFRVYFLTSSIISKHYQFYQMYFSKKFEGHFYFIKHACSTSTLQQLKLD